ncbi:MAG: hypothetical protein E7679_02630 [Ruminococcaceae bacterium]|nr:hypothetical protein [Oscillospiraceae bacterium]
MKNLAKISLCLMLVLCSILLVSCKHTNKTDVCPDGSHVFEEWTVLKEASCGETGKRSSVCTVCGISTEEDIPATSMHTVVLELEKGEGDAASQIVKKCSCCNEVLEVQLLSAQGGEPNVLQSNNNVDIDISSYKVIYPQVNALRLSASAAKSLSRAIGAISGEGINALSDLSQELAYTDKEILVGDTNRAESKATKALLVEKGFAIAVIDNKIAIVGSDEIQTILAINYFRENYIVDTAQISIPKSIVVKSDAQNVTLSADYTVVFAQGLDDAEGNTIESNAEANARDYPCVAADVLVAYLGLSNRTTDDNETELEVLIGKVNREVYSDFAATLDGNEYGILVKDGKIVIASHSYLGLEICVSQFKELLAFAKEDSAWVLPDGFYVKGVTNDDWVTNFPRPSGTLYNTFDSNDDSLQFLYTGVSSSDFDTYTSQLVSAGYSVLTENTIENSKFKTLVNEAKGITLHVSYNDFKHEATYAVQDTWYVDYEKCIRIISAPLDSVTLPDSGLLTPNPSYTKVADSALSAVGLDVYAAGMSYIIRLEDGRFIIYDGGKNAPTPTDGEDTDGYTNTDEVAQLWEALVELHRDAYGSAPSESQPIHVAAWIITHSHGDHFEVCRDFLATYGKDSRFDIDYMIGNFPAANALRTARGDDNSDADDMGQPNAIYNMQQDVTGGFKYVKAHSGHKYYIANVTIEVLMTYEDHNPATIQSENDVCTITRIFIGGTSTANGATTTAASAASTVKVVFLGDAQRYQSRYLCAMYGSYLQSEMVQVAHHGNIGCEIALYDTISPQALLIPYSAPMVHKILHKDANLTIDEYAKEVGYYLRNSLASVQYIYASAEGNVTTIDITSSGAQYGSFYNALTGSALNYTSDSNVYFWNGYLKK